MILESVIVSVHSLRMAPPSPLVVLPLMVESTTLRDAASAQV